MIIYAIAGLNICPLINNVKDGDRGKLSGTMKHAVESVAPQVVVPKMILMLIKILVNHQNANELLLEVVPDMSYLNQSSW